MKPCYIYKAFKGDKILYVGISDKVNRRFSQHKASSDWYSIQDKILVCELPNRSICKLYETYLIKTLQPEFNKAENNGEDFSLMSFDEANMEWSEYGECNYEEPLLQDPWSIIL
jgi:excinuclease UvrABC nuclease subunit